MAHCNFASQFLIFLVVVVQKPEACYGLWIRVFLRLEYLSVID